MSINTGEREIEKRGALKLILARDVSIERDKGRKKERERERERGREREGGWMGIHTSDGLGELRGQRKENKNKRRGRGRAL